VFGFQFVSRLSSIHLLDRENRSQVRRMFKKSLVPKTKGVIKTEVLKPSNHTSLQVKTNRRVRAHWFSFMSAAGICPNDFNSRRGALVVFFVEWRRGVVGVGVVWLQILLLYDIEILKAMSLLKIMLSYSWTWLHIRFTQAPKFKPHR
jgi:hypothetical protein